MLTQINLYISNKITHFLDIFYYNNLKKLYNEKLDKIFEFTHFPVIKPEYFIYSQYYFIYTFIYYLNRNRLLYTLSLNLIPILDNVFQNICSIYNYNPVTNILFLKNTAYILMMYLLHFKICLHNTSIFNKLLLISSSSTFYLLYRINNVYKKRLESIENKDPFDDEFKILIISPDKKFIKRIIDLTQLFTYGNYLFFINILLFVLF
jgi:hypothetical protein